MTDKRVTGTLVDAITDLVNLILAGGVPDFVRAEFLGASLLAFAKKGGGVRPIAVGLTLRRLVSKVANFHAVQSCASILAPRQLGVGIKGGAEALAHAARRYLSGMGPGQVLVKLDFSNAFNTLRRDSMLEATAQFAPDLLPYVISVYGSTTMLSFGDEKIESMEGIQQDDPLGSLLFCITIHKALQSID